MRVPHSTFVLDRACCVWVVGSGRVPRQDSVTHPLRVAAESSCSDTDANAPVHTKSPACQGSTHGAAPGPCGTWLEPHCCTRPIFPLDNVVFSVRQGNCAAHNITICPWLQCFGIWVHSVSALSFSSLIAMASDAEPWFSGLNIGSQCHLMPL